MAMCSMPSPSQAAATGMGMAAMDTGKYGYGTYGSKYGELPEEEVAEEDPDFDDGLMAPPKQAADWP